MESLTRKPLRSCQNKQLAFWFYRVLSIFYDSAKSVMWTESMRDEALEELDLTEENLKVVDVGGGTGFTTLGLVRHVKPENITLLDQSPHQLAKAMAKTPLKNSTFVVGNAEDLPFPDDFADRYVSAGRILARSTERDRGGL
uniref:MPBQ/MBSQ family SAM-binding methyltransferase profile domain-containing protein n=1 Tax=Nelumbo nucifera TaxID=4432 RepID=A0A822XWM1_NELNU|nr:TPA_asm: hypothetical protein HUJ06_024869 [Nelumbo nucifera]